MMADAIANLLQGVDVPATLNERASRLWLNCERNRREWLRAVAVIRSTRRGWLLDEHAPRVAR